MPGRVGDFARRVVSFGQGFVDAFLRDNKVIPAVLALLALFVFSWIVAGALLGPPDGERVSNSEEVAQTGQPAGQDPLAPEVENRNADSYAAYRSKDPFRELVAPAPEETTDAPVTSDEPDAAATPTDTTTPSSPSADGDDGGGDDGGAGGAGGADDTRSRDSDDDGLTNRRETALGQDARDSDTDNDGILDGDDDSNDDGRPDSRPRNPAAGGGNGSGGAGGAGGGGGGSAGGAGGGGAGPGGGAGGAGGGGAGVGGGLPPSGGGYYRTP